MTAESSGPARPPRLLFLAFGFPPAGKSSAYRLRELANEFVRQGWDVTVLNADRDCWRQDYGLDESLLDTVDPRIRIVEVAVRREDLDTDIRTFTEERALQPARWNREYAEQAEEIFPERLFGWWRGAIEEAALALQAETPFDLCLFSGAPFVQLAAARRLFEEHRVPYAVDFHDGWSLDVVGTGSSEPADSPVGRWEARALADAVEIWFVNDPIADYYRERYPELADRMRVVRNGFDARGIPPPREGSADPLRFGHLGTISFSPDVLRVVLAGWRRARELDPAVARATLEVRGYMGASHAKGVNQIAELLLEAAGDGVAVGGPVPKDDVRDVYGEWDVLLFIVIGGQYMTSGKIYEYMATGLPIMSVHQRDHDASTLLSGYPLWTEPPAEFEPERVAEAFVAAASAALAASPDLRQRSREHGARFSWERMLEPAVRGLTQAVRP